MSPINKNLLDAYIVLFYLLNYIHSSSVITITTNTITDINQSIIIKDNCSLSVRKIDNNSIISLTHNNYNQYYFKVEYPGSYEINITTDEKSLSFPGLLSECCIFDSIVIKNSGDKINITDLSYTFSNCNVIHSIDLSQLDMSGVTTFNSIFSGCHNLVSVNFGNLLPQNLKDMGYMFYKCYNLISINLSNFDTSNVIDMSCMFCYCNNLISINLSSFETSNVIDMNGMFYECYNLISINLSNFDTSNVNDMSYMFSDSNSLIH